MGCKGARDVGTPVAVLEDDVHEPALERGSFRGEWAASWKLQVAGLHAQNTHLHMENARESYLVFHDKGTRTALEGRALLHVTSLVQYVSRFHL